MIFSAPAALSVRLLPDPLIQVALFVPIATFHMAFLASPFTRDIHVGSITWNGTTTPKTGPVLATGTQHFAIAA